MSLDEYLLIAGMTQSLMLEYSIEAIRFKLDVGGCLFWMYNDTWGETGWTIIDYYLRRKISYYGVKRAFSPQKLIMRELDGEIVVVGLNDTSVDLEFNLEAGYLSFDGTATRDSSLIPVCIPAYSRVELLRLEKKQYDLLSGTWFACASEQEVDPAVLLAGDIRKLQLPEPKINVIESHSVDGDLIIKLSSETFVHGLYIKVNGADGFSDNWFNLLPGQVKTVRVYGGAGLDYEYHHMNM